MHMKTEIRLVVTDMDGTLLDSAHRLPDSFAESFCALSSRGIDWVIASGRQYANLRHRFDSLGVCPVIIAENGALAYEAHADRPCFSDLTDLAFFDGVMRTALEVPDAVPVLCGPEYASVCGRHPEYLEEVGLYFRRTELWRAPEEVHNPEVCKLAVFHPHAGEVLLPRLKVHETSECRVIHSGAHWIDIQRVGIDKGNALRALLAGRGLHPEQAVVFGDYLNDVGMMTIGTHSVAMANALPEVKAVAGHLTATNDQEGVLVYLRTLGLL